MSGEVAGGGAVAGVDLRDATAIAAAVAAGEVSAEQVVTACLSRITEREDELRAWAFLDTEAALARARALDRLDAPKGPLHGVPVGVKDIVDTDDQPTRHGSPIYADNRPARDATVVARLRAAGAIVVGKTVTTEFALFSPGPTRNPHDLSRTPGGSSSGSAAAVADGQVPLAIGTQTAGSVVRPASFCGILGAKPTIGSLSLDGVKLCSSSLDTVGLFGNDVDSVVLGLEVMAGDGSRFGSTAGGGAGDVAAGGGAAGGGAVGGGGPGGGGAMRLGFARTPWWGAVDPACAAVIEDAVERLARDLDVVEVDLPDGFEPLVDAQLTVMNADLLDELAWEIEHHPDELSDELREVVRDAQGAVDGRADALAIRDRCRDRLPELFEPADVVLAPAVLGEAPAAATTGDPMLCRPWTLLGTPTVAVPGLRGPAGLPLGVQVIAGLGRDSLALAAAHRVGQLLAGR